jgi:DNA-binding CsgD family transcriptional regulator
MVIVAAAMGDEGVMAAALRRTGIDVLGRVPWGAHICLFYETKQDLLDTVVAYFEAGLQNDEFCVWAVSNSISEQEARAALAQQVPNFAQHLAAGSIEIVPSRDWYLSADDFDLQKIAGGWDAKLRTALANGFEGMRVSGNAFWLATHYWTDFSQYEHELDRSLAGRRMIALLTYSLRASTGTDVLDVARAHDVTVARRMGNWEVMEAFDIDGEDKPLTQRELEVLAWVARGKSSWEIAEILSITKRTADEHAHQATQKLGATNRTQAVAIAVRERLVDPTKLHD